MGPLSGVVIWKILYWFGDEDLVIWTATSASMNRSTASKILEWVINPLSAIVFIDIIFEIYQKFLTKINKYLTFVMDNFQTTYKKS